MVENSIIEAGWESESSFKSWAIAYESSGALADPLALVAPGLDAMFLVTDELLEPVTVSATIAWLDTELGITSGHAPRWEWKLAQRGQDYRLWPGETLVEDEAIDRAAIERFLRRACAQAGAPGMVACPTQITFSCVRARLLEPVPAAATALRLDRKEGPATVPIERGGGVASVTGPQDGFITAPVEVTLWIDASELTLRVGAHWSPWADRDRPGTRAIEERIARLVSLGWELTE